MGINSIAFTPSVLMVWKFLDPSSKRPLVRERSNMQFVDHQIAKRWTATSSCRPHCMGEINWRWFATLARSGPCFIVSL
jgi:hypothetical protein